MSRSIPYLDEALSAVEAWKAQYASFEVSEVGVEDAETMRAAWADFAARLGRSYPFFHPDYAGQMLKPPHPVAAAGYLAAMLVNPNNHALDGGPETSHMEKEVVAALAAMFGYSGTSLGHLTSNGTIANLEALWVGREVGSRFVVASEDAHYTHARMSGVLGVPFRSVPVGADGRMDVDALDALLSEIGPCTVVATAGTTGFGHVDPIADIVTLRERRDFRLHVDAAYGGFFRTLTGTDVLPEETSRHLEAIAEADSIVVDPHKHGLQPYGCGAVLFRDAAVGRVYRHDSPYTYFTSNDLHLGEISLECSRAGAAAAALWLTHRAFPFDESGIGRVLRETLRAARDFAGHARDRGIVVPSEPELDIVIYHGPGTAEQVDASSQRVFDALMRHERPVYLSLFRTLPGRIGLNGAGPIRVLRSVLMKPEHRAHAPQLARRISDAMRDNATQV